MTEHEVLMMRLLNTFAKNLKQQALMPLKVSVLDFGRPTKGAACALIARLRLLHASPLFNGGYAAQSYFGIGKDQPMAPTMFHKHTMKRWAVAAAAKL